MKKFLFFGAILSLFILFAILSLFLAGYIINLEKRKIEQTGAIYVKTFPQKAKVTIDKKINKEKSPFSGTLFIKNLLPKEYHLLVQKEGFYSWEKKLKVKEQKVETAYILLFPKRIHLSEIAQNVNDFLVSEDGKIFIFQKENENWKIKKLPDEILLESKMFPKNTEFLSFSFLEKPSMLLIKVKEKKVESFIFDLEEKKLQKEEKKEGVLFQEKINNEEFILREDGFLAKNKEIINKNPILIQKEKTYSIKVFKDFIFIFEGDNNNKFDVYLFNKENESFEKIFDKISGMSLSPLKDRILFFSDKEIFILFLRDTFFEIEKRKGEIMLLARISEKIDQVFWLNNKYLAFLSSGKIKVAEIDDREKVNILDLTPSFSLSDKKIEKFYIEPKKTKIFVLTSENILLAGHIFLFF
jgi:hypothetical protein